MTKAEDNKNELAQQIEAFTKDAREFIENFDVYEEICKKLIDIYFSSTDTSNAQSIAKILPGNILYFITFVSEANENVLNEFLKKSNLTEEEAKVVSNFKKRYGKILRNVIRPIRLETMGLKNVITGVSVCAHKFNQHTDEPVVELNLLSFGKPVLHTEMPIENLYSFARILMEVVRDNLEILTSNKLEIKKDFIKRMKDISENTQEILTEISNLLDKMSKETDIDEEK